MLIIIGLMAALLVLCVGIIYSQHNTIECQRKRLIEALDWIEPEEIVLPEDWET